MWYNKNEVVAVAKRKKRVRYDRMILSGFLVLVVIGGTVWAVTLRGKDNKNAQGNNDTPVDVQHEDKEGMEALYFYDETRQERYKTYKKANPEMSDEEVVWRVNVDIDLEDYTDMSMIAPENSDNIVLLVNKHFRLKDDYEPANLEWYEGYQMTTETKEAFSEMASAALLEDLHIRPGSTYRSIDTQRDLYNSYVTADGQEEADTYSARAGSSEHHTGRAIDLVGPDWSLDSFENTPERTWVHENGYKYGFILRYGKDIVDITGYMYEPWHITYVGKEAATIMHDKGIKSLEEYYVKYVMYHPTQQ